MATACEPGAEWVQRGGDCDDRDDEVNPEGVEACNGVDDDCDGTTDTTGIADMPTWYIDIDGDGYGDPSYAVTRCEAPASYFVLDGGDCDDTASEVNPSFADICGNEVDDNCDGSVDETCTADADADGFDLTEGDCDDFDATLYPSAPEGTSTDIDNDCSGVATAEPVAIAESGGPSYTCTDLGLDASGSYDLAGLSLTYDWALAGAPSDSSRTTADIATTRSVAPEFQADVAGTYSFDLVVDNGDVESVPSELDLDVATRRTNSAPVTWAGADQGGSGTATCTPISYGVSYACYACGSQNFTLSATGVTDADGDDLTYAWSVTSGGVYGTLSAATGSSVTLAMDGAETTYGEATDTTVEVQLTATDCMGTSSTDSVSVTYTCTGA